MFRPVFAFPLAAGLACLCLSACQTVLPGQVEGPFIPRDDYPLPPNVERLIGPDDCRGSTLSALSADVPAYPPRAYSLGRQGWVVVRFNVLADGNVEDVRVARSLRDGFDRASRRAVEGWQFRPLEGATRLDNCVVMFEFVAGEVQIR